MNTMSQSEKETLKGEILDMSRQARIRPLTPWLSRELDKQIDRGRYPPASKLSEIADSLVEDIRLYGTNHTIGTGVIGMSGGVDSALAAALTKKAGWRVIGLTLPIHQNPEETERGIEAIHALGLEHNHVDLTDAYNAVIGQVGDKDLELLDDHATKIRRGNIRARLRMITIYNVASKHKGLVLSTDNLDELFSGFWTLHGDVGDLSPMQSLGKAWEVPMIAKLLGVPEKTYRATPTDGLGISQGDEEQLGATYLELELMFFAMADAILVVGEDLEKVINCIEVDPNTSFVLEALTARVKGTIYKRNSPYNLNHPSEDRYGILASVDMMFDANKTTEPLKKNR